MEGIPNQRFSPILPGLRWLYVGASTNQRSASDVVVPTPCGAVSIRENVDFVHVMLELKIYEGICDPGMRPYSPRVAVGNSIFVPGVPEL